MAALRVFGSNGSPYSVKVRSYLRFKGLHHEWLVRNSAELQEEHARFSRLPLIPTVVTEDSKDGKGFQDSTLIIERFEKIHPEPAMYPKSMTASMRFFSELLEEFGDEWANKWMFHYRWANEVDGRSFARRFAVEMSSGRDVVEKLECLRNGGLKPTTQQSEIDMISQAVYARMSKRLFTIGSTDETREVIETSFLEFILALEFHFLSGSLQRNYLFGMRPTMADFGLAAQIGQCLSDPTAGELIRLHAPQVAMWCERMQNPRVEGAMEQWQTLAPTLEPILKKNVAMFLKWSDAISKAIAAQEKEICVRLGDTKWHQAISGPQRYHAKSLREIRKKLTSRMEEERLEDASDEETSLVSVLRRCECLALLLEAGTNSSASKL